MCEENFAVALTKCFICGKDSDIVMNRFFTKKHAEAVKQMHGKVITKEPCNECKKLMEKGIICISVSNSDKDYRTGSMCVVKPNSFDKIIKDKAMLKDIKAKRVCFIDDSSWDQIGLPRAQKN